MLTILSSVACALCTLCLAAEHDQPALLMLQIDASIGSPAMAQASAAVDSETDVESEIELESGGCLPPIEWMNDVELHSKYSIERVEELIKSGGLDKRPDPKSPGKMLYRIQDWAKQWKSEPTVHSMFKQATVTKLLQNQILLTRQNPDCPDKVQYKVERNFVHESAFAQVFDEDTIRDFLKAEVVERMPYGQGDFQYRVKDDLGLARLIKEAHHSTGPQPQAEVMSKVGVDHKPSVEESVSAHGEKNASESAAASDEAIAAKKKMDAASSEGQAVPLGNWIEDVHADDASEPDAEADEAPKLDEVIDAANESSDSEQAATVGKAKTTSTKRTTKRTHKSKNHSVKHAASSEKKVGVSKKATSGSLAKHTGKRKRSSGAEAQDEHQSDAAASVAAESINHTGGSGSMEVENEKSYSRGPTPLYVGVSISVFTTLAALIIA